jgi:xylan 1,4-beta-xylosidase
MMKVLLRHLYYLAVFLCLTMRICSAEHAADTLFAVCTPGPMARAIEPVLNHPLRNPSVCLGPDGCYYLTGTTGYPDWELTNDGIRLWRSTDLIHWEALGKVWDIDRHGTWQRAFKPQQVRGKTVNVRAVWGPEIHWSGQAFYIVYAMNYGGIGLLKSHADQATGPYEDLGCLVDKGHCPSLFWDRDNTVYLLYNHGRIVRLAQDLGSTDGLPHIIGHIEPVSAKVESTVAPPGAPTDFALTFTNGHYCLFWNQDSGRFGHYTDDVFAAQSDSIFGPYSQPYLAVPHASQPCVFTDKSRRLWATFCGCAQDPGAGVHERVGFVPLQVSKQNRIRPEATIILEKGPAARLQPILPDLVVRHPSVTNTDDPYYYMVATQGEQGGLYEEASVTLWRSEDLNQWKVVKDLWVWDDLGWEPRAGVEARLSAPEICVLRSRGTCLLTFSVSGNETHTWIYKSISGKAQGPYQNIGDSYMVRGRDGFIFEDDDESVYFLWDSGKMACLNDDLSGLQEDRRQLQTVQGRPVGSEGIGLVKIKDSYVLYAAQWQGNDPENATYDLMVALSKNITGPYSPPNLAVPHGGHSTVFLGKDDRWRATFFGNDKTAPFRNRFALVDLEISDSLTIRPRE